MPAFAMTWQIASTLLVWGRLYLRSRKLAGPFGYDDAFMLFAWVCLCHPETRWEESLTVDYGLDDLRRFHCFCLDYHLAVWG